MALRSLLTAVIVAFSSVHLSAATTSPGPDRILIVYNSNWTQDSDGNGIQDSLQVASYYAVKRGVPSANILAVSCTNDSGSNSYYYYVGEYPKFWNEVVTPIRTKLTALGPTNIDIILFCYGTPSTFYTPAGSPLCVDNMIMGLNYYTSAGNISWLTNPYLEETPSFGTDKGHFDHAQFKFNGTEMYLVSRIDGPRGLNGALELVDMALYGDRYVSPQAGYYNGNAYIESRFGQNSGSTKYTDAFLAASSNVINGYFYSYYAADENMAFAERFVTNSGFTLKWENTQWDAEIGQAGATFSDGTSGLTAPRALFYGGWYNFNKYHDVYEWLPGSVACDLNSNSLFRIRTAGGSTFGVNALERGATCVAGVIDEPYLNGHPRPQVLLYYLFQGYNWAEASMLSTPSIGWMPLNIGDPLYAPMQAKTVVKDTLPPTLTRGFPKVGAGASASERKISFIVDDTLEPEVVKAQLDFGTTTSYGTTLSSGQGFWRRHNFTLTGLAANTVYYYRLTLTDPVGNVSTHEYSFSTGSGSAPVISTQPVSQMALSGSTATFSIGVTGAAPFSYQWYRNGVALAGATAPSYTTPTLSLSDSGAVYSVVVFNLFGNAVSSDAVLTVQQNPDGGGGGGGGGGGSGTADSDGDGISDVQELADGTNPLDPKSFILLPMSVTKASGSVKFSTSNADSISVSGVLQGIPAGFNPANVVLVLNAGGATATFVLDAKGRSRTASGSIALTLKPSTRDKATKIVTFLGGSVAFKARLTKGAWADDWADEGVNPAIDASKVPMTMNVTVTLDGKTYGTTATLIYSAKAGKGASFK
ncbi:MAG TPA: TIGR03790 family protein [Planctomycetota bacterium]|nr:TIGR03790 family protein [Planctomycetota bacterium]